MAPLLSSFSLKNPPHCSSLSLSVSLLLFFSFSSSSSSFCSKLGFLLLEEDDLQAIWKQDSTFVEAFLIFWKRAISEVFPSLISFLFFFAVDAVFLVFGGSYRGFFRSLYLVLTSIASIWACIWDFLCCSVFCSSNLRFYWLLFGKRLELWIFWKGEGSENSFELERCFGDLILPSFFEWDCF